MRFSFVELLLYTAVQGNFHAADKKADQQRVQAIDIAYRLLLL
jgi:hypothetical protein